MKYISTRGIDKEKVSSAYAIKKGLSSDGGLYMPEEIPLLSDNELEELLLLSYPERASKILAKFLTDYDYDELLADTKAAYSEEKFGPNPTPITVLGENMYMLELWHGPTAAFKDMALQIMPRLFVRALRKTGENRRAMILVATSGDTGKAALEGYKDVEGTCIKVFYPTDGVSTVQKLQMQTQEGTNVSVVGIRGNFDDAQSGVKEIFSDSDMASVLDESGIFLSSANSINWGRLVPQIVYYISAYCDLLNSGSVVRGEVIDVTVPTGNFGNIFAAYIAKKMGLPIGKLVVASNKNNILTDFIRTGIYDKNREFYSTMSPSMDILISSNLERLLYLTLGQEKTRGYMQSLKECGRYELTEEDRAVALSDFVGYYTDEEKTAETIKDVYENKNCLIDTHTAVAVYAARCYMRENKAERKMLTASTASAYKFARDVYRSLTKTEAPSDIEALAALTTLTRVSIPYPLLGLDKKAVLHNGVIDKNDMALSVREFAGN